MASTLSLRSPSANGVAYVLRYTQYPRFLIRLLDLHGQHRVVAYLDDLRAKADMLNRLQAETAAELDALLPSILDKAFKGEL